MKWYFYLYVHTHIYMYVCVYKILQESEMKKKNPPLMKAKGKWLTNICFLSCKHQLSLLQMNKKVNWKRNRQYE